MMEGNPAGPAVAATVGVYVVVVAGIGFWSARRTKTAGDFFIAGQNIGWFVASLATMSAAFSGFVFIGGPGLMVEMGVASLMICLPVGFTSGLLCWVVGKRLRLLAGLKEIFTIPDLMLARFGSRRVSALSAVAILIGTIGYLGAQLQALALLIESIGGIRGMLGPWSFPAAFGIGLLIIVFYSVAGGMVAGVYTDVVQGGLMLAAAFAVFALCLKVGGGLGAITTAIARAEQPGPGFLDPFGTVPVMLAFSFFFVFGVGLLGQPHMLHKFFMLDNPRDLKWMPLTIGLTQSVCILLWLGIGLTVPALIAEGRMAPLAHPDQAAPRFLLEFAPDLLTGLVFAGVLSAIMSTADSFLNIGAAAIVRDLPKAFGKTVSGELSRGRAAVILLAVSAAGFSWLYGDLIALIGTFAFGTFAAALAPAVAVGFNWRGVTASAAAASMATGMVLNLGLEFMAKFDAGAWLLPVNLHTPMLPSAFALAASFVVLILWSWVGRFSSGDAIDGDVRWVMDL